MLRERTGYLEPLVAPKLQLFSSSLYMRFHAISDATLSEIVTKSELRKIPVSAQVTLSVDTKSVSGYCSRTWTMTPGSR